jgi:hypothetical protein
MSQKMAVETFFYHDGSKVVAVQPGDSRTDLHADYLASPSAFVADPPVTSSDLARVPFDVRQQRGI